MKILFLNPPFFQRFSRAQRSPAVTKSGTLYYPMWIAYAAGFLEEAGFDVLLIDAPAENLSLSEVLRIANDFSPALVVIDTSTPSIYNDIEVAEKIKSVLPGSVIALVGAHVSTLAQETLEFSKTIDLIARGEYEISILEIAEGLKRNSIFWNSIEGISYRDNEKILHNPDRAEQVNLDKLPFVSKVYKKYLNIKNYFFAASLYPEVQILTSRGCPFKCFFCMWPQCFQGRKYRTRSAKSVLEEFMYIKDHLPEVKAVVIEDDTFTIDKNRVMEICGLLIKNKLNLPWNANVRTDLDIGTMKKMKEAGCYLIIVGIESANQKILDNIHKGINSDNIKQFFDNAKKAGLLVHAAFMAGNPGETHESLKDNLRTAKIYMPDTVQFFPLTPYPGTEAYEWAMANGYLKIKSYSEYLTKDGLHNCVIELPGLSREEIMESCYKSRRSFYLNPRYLFYKMKQFLLKPGDAIRTYKAFMTFKKYILKNERQNHD